MGRQDKKGSRNVPWLHLVDGTEGNSRPGRNRLLDLRIDQWRCTCHRSSEGSREQRSKCSNRECIESRMGSRYNIYFHHSNRSLSCNIHHIGKSSPVMQQLNLV